MDNVINGTVDDTTLINNNNINNNDNIDNNNNNSNSNWIWSDEKLSYYDPSTGWYYREDLGYFYFDENNECHYVYPAAETSTNNDNSLDNNTYHKNHKHKHKHKNKKEENERGEQDKIIDQENNNNCDNKKKSGSEDEDESDGESDSELEEGEISEDEEEENLKNNNVSSNIYLNQNGVYYSENYNYNQMGIESNNAVTSNTGSAVFPNNIQLAYGIDNSNIQNGAMTMTSAINDGTTQEYENEYLRLVVLSSNLYDKGSIVLVDTEGLSIGRDKSYEKRLRLPEMQVSKYHAKIYLEVEYQPTTTTTSELTNSLTTALPVENLASLKSKIKPIKPVSKAKPNKKHKYEDLDDQYLSNEEMKYSYDMYDDDMYNDDKDENDDNYKKENNNDTTTNYNRMNLDHVDNNNKKPYSEDSKNDTFVIKDKHSLSNNNVDNIKGEKDNIGEKEKFKNKNINIGPNKTNVEDEIQNKVQHNNGNEDEKDKKEESEEGEIEDNDKVEKEKDENKNENIEEKANKKIEEKKNEKNEENEENKENKKIDEKKENEKEEEEEEEEEEGEITDDGEYISMEEEKKIKEEENENENEENYCINNNAMMNSYYTYSESYPSINYEPQPQPQPQLQPQPQPQYTCSYHFSIIDMGSTHGTFVNGKRLSESKICSKPCPLKNKDIIQIGSTTLVVHYHKQWACSECTITEHQKEIPLLDKSMTTATVNGHGHSGYGPSGTASTNGYDPHPLSLEEQRKNELKRLKNKYRRKTKRMKYNESGDDDVEEEDGSTTNTYIDRAAQRRELYSTNIPILYMNKNIYK